MTEPVAKQAELTLDGRRVLLLGTIAGFAPDGERVSAAFASAPGGKPALLALGIPPDDLPALQRLAESPSGVELELLDEADLLLHREVARFGAVRIPSPDLEAAYAEATASGVPVAAVDLDDATHSTHFTRLVKVRHLVRASSRRRKAFKASFASHADAYSIAVDLDRMLVGKGPHAELEAAREEHMAAEVRRLARDVPAGGWLLAVLPIARLAGVVARLGA